MAELKRVFVELRKIMAPYAEKLDVKLDDESEIYLATEHMQKNGQPLFFGAV